MLIVGTTLFSQNNVGIGTSVIHESAILQLKDTTKGTLVPRTDTASVNAYVNSLFPNPGVADGLIIYDVDASTYFYFDGNLGYWVQINRLRGAQGTTGITGPTGLRGFPARSTHWRDSAFAQPIKRPSDSCGDYYHETNTGLIWQYDCQVNDWIGPVTRWRMLGYGFQTYERTTTSLYAPMPSGPGDSLYLIQGLSTVIRVPPDSVAHVTVTSQGMVQKRISNSSTYNYMKFDHVFGEIGGPPLARINKNITVSISPNSPPILGNPDGQYDKVPWSITSSFTLHGKISPPGNPLPFNDYRTYQVETHGGQLFAAPRLPGNQSDVIISDGGTGKNGLWENFAIQNVYVIYERSRKAPFPR